MSDESTHPTYLWWNGECRPWHDATVHVTELGWSTVNAVFEGIRGYWDDRTEELYVFRLPEHLKRFAESMKLVRYRPDYTAEQLTDAIIDLLRANDTREDTYIRPLAYTADTSNRRFSQVATDAAVLINTQPMASHLLTGVTNTAKVSSWRRISEDVMPPRIKNISNYRNSQLAAWEARLDGYDTAILLNDQGKVTEGPGACLVLVRDGRLITPDIASGILESITRDALLVLGRELLGLEVVERPVDRTELYLAEELFTCGTAAEITPIVGVDKYEIGRGQPGPITAALEQALHDVLRGREERFSHWRTPVGVRVAVPA